MTRLSVRRLFVTEVKTMVFVIHSWIYYGNLQFEEAEEIIFKLVKGKDKTIFQAVCDYYPGKYCPDSKTGNYSVVITATE